MPIPLLSTSSKTAVSRALESRNHAILIIGGNAGNEDEIAEYVAARLPGSLAARISDIKIDEVRDLLRTSQNKAAIDQIYLIKGLHAAPIEAQNAMLKMIEEPIQGTTFVLSSADDNSVLPTIKSRAQIIRLQTPSLDDYRQFVDLDDHDLDAAYAASGGNWKLFQDYRTDGSEAFESAKTIIKSSPTHRLSMIADLTSDRSECIKVIMAMEQIFRYLMLSDASKSNIYSKKLQSCLLTRQRLQANGNAKLLLDNLFVSI
jgi:hypothetical protein